jgi:transcriptional regulator with XRE-family HTH domain
MADGVAALRAWHEFKGMLLQALADAAGLCKPYLSQIEGGKRTGTSATLKKLARALDLPVGALTPWRPALSTTPIRWGIDCLTRKPLNPPAFPAARSLKLAGYARSGISAASVAELLPIKLCLPSAAVQDRYTRTTRTTRTRQPGATPCASPSPRKSKITSTGLA